MLEISLYSKYLKKVVHTGSGVGILALGSPILAHAIAPPFTTSSGLAPKKEGFQRTRSANFPTCQKYVGSVRSLIDILIEKKCLNSVSLRQTTYGRDINIRHFQPLFIDVFIADYNLPCILSHIGYLYEIIPLQKKLGLR